MGVKLAVTPTNTKIEIHVHPVTNQHTGKLTAVVTVKGIPSHSGNYVPVGIVWPSSPHVIPADFKLAQSSAGNVLEIRGSNFGNVQAKISITLTPTFASTTILRVYENLIVVQIGDTSSSNV